jgi:hypothetical protein
MLRAKEFTQCRDSFFGSLTDKGEKGVLQERRMDKENKSSTWVIVFLIAGLTIISPIIADAQVTQSGWEMSTIDSNGNVAYTNSIAIDSNNRVHISYSDDTNGDLKYATNVSGSWVISTIDSAGVVGWDSSIAIDSNKKVHISYYSYDNVLKYATNASGYWVTSAIDSLGTFGAMTSIAIDSNNRVHISYLSVQDSIKDLKYATNASSSWVTSTVDSYYGGGFGSVHSIAVDSNNKVHITYSDEATGDFKHATNASGSWVKSTIDSFGFSPSIGVDSNNRVHICYMDANYDLKYATNSSSEPSNNPDRNWGLPLTFDKSSPKFFKFF